MAQQLNLFVGYAYTDAYWSASDSERKSVRQQLVEASKGITKAAHFYSVFPARSDTDILLWSSQDIEDDATVAKVLKAYNTAFEPLRKYISPSQSLWGLTMPSQYSRGKSEQDIDPMDSNRCPYLVVYPFTKTKEWYLMSMDSRQGMMNEHIKLGKQFFSIKQLLLYSFGLQDQEFVVSYEMEDAAQFSDLVKQLRSTEARRFTLSDNPLITAIYHTEEEFVRS